ncbi:MAG TPA: hypothetical protein VG518_10760 [Solirubrobacterales bacterium]|nr:hypothetical protein [Solirubrobacterales bacterium]
MRALLPSRLRRRWIVAVWTLCARSLAVAGLLVAVILSAASQNGLLTLAFLTVAAVVGVGAGRALRVARCATADARGHRAVKGALSVLSPRGWGLEHDVHWPDHPGDGHLAIAPAGALAFVIRDCHAPIADFDLSRAQELASSLSQEGCHFVPICVAPARDAHSFSERGVICCTPQQLVSELLDAERAFALSLFDGATQTELLYGQGAGA